MLASQVWNAYAAGDAAARDQLLAAHLGLVHHVARKVGRTLSTRPDFDELVSAGTLGLMSALEAFDATRGHAFSTFAIPRVRGAILDELRRQDHVPRSVRRKSRDLGAAREALGSTLGRAATDRELAAHLQVDLDTLWRWQADTEGAMQLPLERRAADAEGELPSLADLLADDREESVDDRLTREQQLRILRDAVLALGEQERVVLTLYFFEELKLHEIADFLGLTESRVSQIRTKALGRLRTTMGAKMAA